MVRRCQRFYFCLDDDARTGGGKSCIADIGLAIAAIDARDSRDLIGSLYLRID